ncbi:hypothetical protein [Nitrosospira briensis]|uniref:hypothetical protein n=1 Tax=Nitrosospira briensis TaxID=35799 RepID=UPI001160D1D7|nr:hypothetical protein [Nitrosospira briensis]
MMQEDSLHHMAFIFLVSSLQSGLNSFCGTWLRCNSLEWGVSKRCTRRPAKQGSGSVGDAATAFWAPAFRYRVALSFGRHCSTLRDRAIPRHSTLLRLACSPQTAHSTPSNYRI